MRSLRQVVGRLRRKVNRVGCGGLTTSPPVVLPVAGFSGTPRTGLSSLPVTFTDTSLFATSVLYQSSSGGGYGNFSNVSRNPVESFTSGTYSVKQFAFNGNGTDVLTQTNYIVVSPPPPPAPVADFTGTPLSGTSPLDVTFTDASTNSPTSWLWKYDTGGGFTNFSGTPTAQNPTETFSSAGNVAIRLTASNAGGNDTKTRTDYITVTSPPPPPPATLVAYYRLDDSDDPRLDQIRGGSGDATTALAGTVTTVSGYLHTLAVASDGVMPDYLTASDVGLPSGNDPRSVIAWVYFNSLPTAFATNTVIAWGDGIGGPGTFNNVGLIDVAGDGSDCRWTWTFGFDTEVPESVESVSIGQWYFLVAKYDGTNVTFKVNSVLDAGGGPPSVTVNTALNTLYIVNMDGVVDGAGVYAGVTTDVQDAALWNGGDGFDPTL